MSQSYSQISNKVNTGIVVMLERAKIENKKRKIPTLNRSIEQFEVTQKNLIIPMEGAASSLSNTAGKGTVDHDLLHMADSNYEFAYSLLFEFWEKVIDTILREHKASKTPEEFTALTKDYFSLLCNTFTQAAEKYSFDSFETEKVRKDLSSMLNIKLAVGEKATKSPEDIPEALTVKQVKELNSFLNAGQKEVSTWHRFGQNKYGHSAVKEDIKHLNPISKTKEDGYALVATEEAEVIECGEILDIIRDLIELQKFSALNTFYSLTICRAIQKILLNFSRLCQNDLRLQQIAKKLTVDEMNKTRPGHNRQPSLELKDNHFYTDEEMQILLKIYLKDHSDIEILSPMLGTDWPGEEGTENTFKKNLLEYKQQRMQLVENSKLIKNNVIIPVNLNKNHWILLYFIYPQGNDLKPNIQYFDPLGNQVPLDLKNSIENSDLYPQAKIKNISQQVQKDGYNCGPWVVEAAKAIIEGKDVGKSLDMNEVRERHRNALIQVQAKNTTPPSVPPYSASSSNPSAKSSPDSTSGTSSTASPLSRDSTMHRRVIPNLDPQEPQASTTRPGM